MKKFHRKSGFTLIELLIVMVIIAILATLGIVAYTNTLKNARNSKRISDLKSISAAYEQEYTAAGGTYPFSATNPTCVTTTALQGGMPQDPSSGTAYPSLSGATVGSATCSASAYCLCVALENSFEGNSTSNSCGDINSSNSADKDFYCIKNQQ